MIRWLLRILLTLVLVLAAGVAWLWQADRYQADGRFDTAAMQAPVRVVRDEQGVPYIHAASLEDAIRAQGFVTAQDRLFQIELERYLAHGRLAELIGEPGLKSDIPVRVAGVPRLGARHAQLLAGTERRLRELYLEGMNEYITRHREEHPVALRVLGLQAQPWTLEDSMTLGYFLNWSSSANLSSELLTQMIIDRVGPARAAEIAQLSVNPDVAAAPEPRQGVPVAALRVGLRPGDLWWGDAWGFRVGSNNWVVGPARSATGAPLVVNDPHIDARTLPGLWHPVALVAPGLRAVGVGGAGIPGLALGRNEDIAWGITNSYGDVIDLYLERQDPADPGRYLEGDRSLPFEVSEEVLRVRDRAAAGGYREQRLTVRRTRRGPVISDHGMGVGEGRLVSMRWSVAEAMAPDDGAGTSLFLAHSVAEARDAVARVNAPYNYVVADRAGNIAHFTAGRVPVRVRGDGSRPLPVTDDGDAWAGMIPAAQMPSTVNPARGWAGTANHRTLPADYPYAYSTYFAASWRYRRMMELLDPPGTHTPMEHWRYMWDTRNVMAAAVVPWMARALEGHEDTRDLAAILRGWNFDDDPDLVAPSVFQATYRHFARLVFADELGPEVTERLIDNSYYWQDRLLTLLPDDANPWFDDVTTPARETRDDLFHRAAIEARTELTQRLGSNPAGWRWGRLHTITFFSPMIPGQLVAGLLGAGTHPKDGSGETLNRGSYREADPYAATFVASMRFVADLADPDKVMAVLIGGASGRQFDPHLRDQVEPWLRGEPRYLWFSDAAIDAHRRHELRLEPPAQR